MGNVSTLFTHTLHVRSLNANKRKCVNIIIPNTNFNMQVKYKAELSRDNFGRETSPLYFLLQMCILKFSHTQDIRQDKIDNMFRLIKSSSDPF
jgi:hypothetical protein